MALPDAPLPNCCLYVHGDACVVGSLRVDGKVLGVWRDPAVDAQLKDLEALVAAQQALIADLASRLEEVYLAPGMPGAPTGYSQ